MTAILTAAEMRAAEAWTVDQGRASWAGLMERAGAAVAEAIQAEWPVADGRRRGAVVLCGPGNNGGDGLVVGRLLAEAGWWVQCFAFVDPDRLSAAARANLARCEDMGLVTLCDAGGGSQRETDAVIDAIGRASVAGESLVVDALFGTGLARPLEGGFRRIVNYLRLEDAERRLTIRVVAVDVPSGLCADSGRVLQVDGNAPWAALAWAGAVAADLTVTFQVLRPGHLLAEGPHLCGRPHGADIGVNAPGRKMLRGVEAPRAGDLGKRSGHKYGYGHAVILSGGVGKGGAARMAARGALRIGAGLVTLAVPPAALQENAAALDAVMLRSVKDAGALAAYLADDRLNALCAGPGLGLGEAQEALVAAVLDLKRPTVLDADALTLVSRDDALRARLHDKVVLTPHEGEFARLFPEIDARWRAPATTGPAFSKVDAAREAAKAAGCVVLLKGPDTVIATPDGRAAINAAVYDRAAPWLATAGSGDVLAGFITGLLARGFTPFDAACTAAWLHVECARSFGPGLIAEDLPEELPKVFRALGL